MQEDLTRKERRRLFEEKKKEEARRFLPSFLMAEKLNPAVMRSLRN